jgi:hypothetical protein
VKGAASQSACSYEQGGLGREAICLVSFHLVLPRQIPRSVADNVEVEELEVQLSA